MHPLIRSLRPNLVLLRAKRFKSNIGGGGSGNGNTTVTNSTNPAMMFPCLDKMEQVSEELRNQLTCATSDSATVGTQCQNEPAYGKVMSGFDIFKSDRPFYTDYGGVLPNFKIAYETWGKLNEDKSNAILIHTGLSASSHAHSTSVNPQPGWWEKFIGPGNVCLDTNKWFLICTNVLGGCYGSTGPSSPDPADGLPYASRFPMLSVHDMVRAQERLLKEHFGIEKLHASLGGSMGGMQSLAYAQLFPNGINKVISISGCARSHPSSIASRHSQRQVLMADPNWNRGFYYPTADEPNRIPPHVGMKLAREIATVTYRSGPEWESRFGTERLDDEISPVLCPDFLIETYLDHQGEKFSLEYDANSFLYISKTMDLFDLSLSHLKRSIARREKAKELFESGKLNEAQNPLSDRSSNKKKHRTSTVEESYEDLRKGCEPLLDKDTLVVGVRSDGLMPCWQQREIYSLLGGDSNPKVTHVELQESESYFGHDTFLLDVEHIGGSIGQYLSK